MHVCRYVATSYRIEGYFQRCKFSRISRMGSLLGKIYSGLLHEVRLWVAIAEIGTDAIMSMQMAYKHLSLKPWIAKYFDLQLQPKNLSGWVRALILQVINALRNKGLPMHTRLLNFFYVHSYTANGS